MSSYALTGPLAQFSRGAIVRELASNLTAQFADNLRERIATVAPAGMPPTATLDVPPLPESAPSDTDASPASAGPVSTRLDLGQVLGRVLRTWLATRVGRLTDRLRRTRS
jgi:hypothetical protein